MPIYGQRLSIVTYVPEKVVDKIDYERGNRSRSSYVAEILENYCKINEELR